MSHVSGLRSQVFLCVACCLLLVTGVVSFFLVSFAQDEFLYDPKGKRNPFIPLVTSDGRLLKLDKEETAGDLAIEGIIYDKNGRSYAIVNGIIAEVGGFVDDYQVLKIEENKIIFVKEGQIKEVEFKKGENQ